MNTEVFLPQRRRSFFTTEDTEVKKLRLLCVLCGKLIILCVLRVLRGKLITLCVLRGKLITLRVLCVLRGKYPPW